MTRVIGFVVLVRTCGRSAGGVSESAGSQRRHCLGAGLRHLGRGRRRAPQAGDHDLPSRQRHLRISSTIRHGRHLGRCSPITTTTAVTARFTSSGPLLVSSRHFRLSARLRHFSWPTWSGRRTRARVRRPARAGTPIARDGNIRSSPSPRAGSGRSPLRNLAPMGTIRPPGRRTERRSLSPAHVAFKVDDVPPIIYLVGARRARPEMADPRRTRPSWSPDRSLARLQLARRHLHDRRRRSGSAGCWRGESRVAPHWSPDGRKILYMAHATLLTARSG